jgi:excisionase family DNA binding protein
MRATVEPAYMDYPRAESYTGLNRVTLWRLVKRGELRASKVGRAVRFSRADLDAFMASKAA